MYSNGSFYWNELMTRDAEAAKRFYGATLGWTFEAMEADGAFIHFINEAFKHYKPIGASGEGVDLLLASDIQGIDLADPQTTPFLLSDQGVVTTRDVSDLDPFSQALIGSIMAHRHWDRPDAEAVPA